MELRKLLQQHANPAPEAFTPEGFAEPVYLRRLTINELFGYLERIKDQDPQKSSVATLAIALVNPDGSAVFDSEKPEDRELLASLPPKLAMAVVTRFRKINQVGEDSAAPVPAAT